MKLKFPYCWVTFFPPSAERHATLWGSFFGHPDTHGCYCSAATSVAYIPLPAVTFLCPLEMDVLDILIPVFFYCSCNSLFSALKMGGETASSVVRWLSPLNMPFDGSVFSDVLLSPLSLFWELLYFPALAPADIPDLLSERIQMMCRETDTCEEGPAVGSVLARPRQHFCPRSVLNRGGREICLSKFWDSFCSCSSLCNIQGWGWGSSAGSPCSYHALPPPAYSSWGRG